MTRDFCCAEGAGPTREPAKRRTGEKRWFQPGPAPLLIPRGLGRPHILPPPPPPPAAPARGPPLPTEVAHGGVLQLPERWPAPLGASRRVPGCGCVCSKASTGVPAVNFILIAPPRKVPAPRTAEDCESLSAWQVAEGRGRFGVRLKRGCSVNGNKNS